MHSNWLEYVIVFNDSKNVTFLGSYDCNDVESKNVDYDNRCLNSSSDPFKGLGCNAGGQGEACRFCGFEDFPPC